MQQLWLAHQRIDSIAQLQQVMQSAQKDEELLTGLCVQMMSYYKNGVLRAWLTRQEEYTQVIVPKNQKSLKDAVVGLCEINLTKSNEKNRLYDQLAELCAVPAEHFAAEHVTKTLDAHETLIKEKLQQMMKQSWWNSYKELFASLKAEDWEYVVLNQSQLNQALEQLKDDSTVHRTLYLCESDEMKGKWYSLNLLNLENVKIRGIADPKVQYARMSEHIIVNAEKNRISMQDFVLYFNKRECVISYEKNAVNYKQCMR